MKAKQYNKYSDIPKEYRFDLEAILEGKSYQYWVDQFKSLMEQKITNKDHEYDSIENFLEAKKLSDQIGIITNKIHNYLSNNSNTNVVDPHFKQLTQEFEFLVEDLSNQLGSETNRFFKNIDKIKAWINDPRLSKWKIHYQNEIDRYKHKLSDEIEEYVQKESFGAPSLEEVFSVITNSELDYGTIENSNGKTFKLDPANRITFLKSNDEKLRKGAFENYIKAYLKHKESLSTLLHQHFKQIAVQAKLRNYNSAVEMLISEDKMTDEVLQTMYKHISDKKDVLKKYKKAYAKFYKAKFGSKMQKWDTYRELVNVKSNYSVDEAKDLVIEALKPFGEEYMSQINKAMNENWIDFMPAQSKRSGAYSIGQSYGLEKKYILMNFKGDLDSVETLAHELGHSMHSYYSDTRQDYTNSQYPIFLAEIASIFNELMLFDYLLQNSTSDKLKFQILNNMINGFIGTVMRQIEWSNYEYELFKQIEQGKSSPSFKSLSEIYYQNSLKYSLADKPKKYTEEDTFACMYVPHFYYYFYVYKYAVGQLAANYFFAKYKQEGTSALKYYIDNFLSAGCNDEPLNILKKSGIDLLSEDFYDLGFNYINKLIEEYIKLGNKIFKIKK